LSNVGQQSLDAVTAALDVALAPEKIARDVEAEVSGYLDRTLAQLVLFKKGGNGPSIADLSPSEAATYHQAKALELEMPKLWARYEELKKNEDENEEAIEELNRAMTKNLETRVKLSDGYRESYFRRILESEMTRERGEIALDSAVGQQRDKAKISAKLGEFKWVPPSTEGREPVLTVTWTLKVTTSKGPDFQKFITWSSREGYGGRN
jgi:hypothetical protein